MTAGNYGGSTLIGSEAQPPLNAADVQSQAMRWKEALWSECAHPDAWSRRSHLHQATASHAWPPACTSKTITRQPSSKWLPSNMARSIVRSSVSAG